MIYASLGHIKFNLGQIGKMLLDFTYLIAFLHLIRF